MSFKNKIILIPFMTAMICWVFYTFTTDLYMYSDNVEVALVINGTFGNPLSQYQHPLFCLGLNALSRLLPTVDMVTLVIHFLIFGELVLLMGFFSGYMLQKSVREWKIYDIVCLVLSLLFCVFMSAGLNLWRANYTIQAASFIFTGWLLLSGHGNKFGNGQCIIGTIYSCIGYMLRKEAAWLFIPFVSLYIIEQIWEAWRQAGNTQSSIWKEKNWKSGKRIVNAQTTCIAEERESKKRLSKVLQTMKPFSPVCICTLFLFISQTAFYSIEPYAEAARYNDARTTLVDFPVKSWNVEDDVFQGISRVDYIAAQNWLFADTDIMTTEYLEKMAEAGGRNKYSYTADGLRASLHTMWDMIIKTDVYMSVMFVLCILLSFWNTFCLPKFFAKTVALSADVGAFIILLYFTFRGRAPLRVWQPVLFGVLYVEVGLLLKNSKRIKRDFINILLILGTVILYYAAGQVIAHVQFHESQNAFTGMVNVDYSDYEKTLKADDLYIWPYWHAALFEDISWKKGKLPPKDVLEHNIALGDWTSGQQYYKEFLIRIGHPNPIRDLVYKDNVYIMSNSSYILDFLREHYGEDIQLVPVAEVGGHTAYAVRKSNR